MNDLVWSIQVNSMISRASRRIMLFVIRRFNASWEALSAVYQMYIRHIMAYACPAWDTSVFKAQSDQLELVQKRASRIIMCKRYTGTALETLDFISLHERREQLWCVSVKVCRFPKSILDCFL